MPNSSKLAARAAALAVVALVAVSMTIQYSLPKVAGADAPELAFSAERAMRAVDRIARQPHPIYSAAKLSVRDDIALMIEEAGLRPEFQDDSVVSIRKKTGGDVANVWARIEAADGGSGAKPILFVAHYDSVPFGPGALNDASGCAVLLEAARALRSAGNGGGWPARDIVFLWTDGEEFGQLGAEAYLLSGARMPALAINVEYSLGPQFMSGFMPGNGRLLDAAAAAGVRPCGYSWLDLLTSGLGFDNDLSPFKEAGIPGMTLASLASYVEYHTARDLPRACDRRAMQESGEMIAALARGIGSTREDDFQGEPQSFMTLAGRLALRYPASLSPPLAILAAALLAAALAVLARRRRLRVGQALLGALACLAVMAASAALGKVVSTLAGLARADYAVPRYSSRLPGDWLWGLAQAVLGIALCLFTRAKAAGRLPFLAVPAGFATVLCAGALILSVAAPSSSCILLLPVLVLSACLLAASALPAGWAESILAPAALAIGLTFLPLGALIWTGLGMGGMGFLCPIAAIACLGWPLFPRVPSPLAARAPAIAGALGAALSVSALALVGFAADCPAPTNLGYALNLDAGASAWFVLGGAKTDWQREAAAAGTGKIELGPVMRFSPIVPSEAFAAPAIDLAPPVARLVSESRSGGRRLIELEVSAPRPGALILGVPASVGLESIEIGGRLYDPAGLRIRSARGGDGEDRYQLTYYPLFPKGLRISLAISDAPPRDGAPIPLLIAYSTDELLPEIPRPPLPDMTAPQNDSTFVVRTCAL